MSSRSKMSGSKKSLGGVLVALLGLSLILVGWIPNGLAQSAVVIQELKKLRATLPVNDPSRTELSLRIADRLTDESFSTQTAASQALASRKEAISLYQEVLPKLQGSRLTKVRFQMARLFLELSDTKSAEPLLILVEQQGDSVDLKREAALRLAEVHEGKDSKKAEQYFLKALSICHGTDTCSYAHYRMGWIKKNQGDLLAAIEEMKQALWDSKGQAREEAFRDLIVFMGQEVTQPEAHVSFIETLSEKSKKVGLLKDLAFSYLSAGNKDSAVKILDVVLAREPSIDLELKYLEELYGVGPWEKFKASLDRFAQNVQNEKLKSEIKNPIEAEKIALRLAIQLDGDRTTRKERTPEFQSLAYSVIELFPKSKERLRLVEGWIASESDVSIQLKQIADWLAQEKFNWTAVEQAELLEMRIGIAQKAKNQDETISDIQKWLALVPTVASLKKREREYAYARAYALYEKKELAQALHSFQLIAQVNGSTQPDQWAIQSQNLALDILNQQKDLAGLKAQAELWLKNEKLSKNQTLAKEIQEMRDVVMQASFEQAVALGATTEALALFKGFCEQKMFLPKSCDNSKTLAIKLSRHPELIEILKLRGETSELNSELEAGGYFAEAARGYEKELLDSKTAGFTERIKVALMYELGDQMSERNRILSSLLTWANQKKLKPTEAEELVIALALEDAGLFDSKHVSSSWSDSFKSKAAESLESRGQGTALTQKFIMSQKLSTGPAWNRFVSLEMKKLVEQERATGFYGRDGERKFQLRVKKIKDLGAWMDRYSPGAPPDLRVQMWTALMKSHQILSEQVILSPIPAGLTPDQETKIREGLAELAKPFDERAKEIQSMIQTEIAKVTDENVKAQMNQWLTSGDTITWSASSAHASIKSNANSESPALKKEAIAKLHQNPKDLSALKALDQYYRDQGKARLAYYFEGRMRQISQETKSL